MYLWWSLMMKPVNLILKFFYIFDYFILMTLTMFHWIQERSSLLKNKNLDLTIISSLAKTFSTSKKLLFLVAFTSKNISLKQTLDFDNFKGNFLLKRDFYYFYVEFWVLLRNIEFCSSQTLPIFDSFLLKIFPTKHL